jgi:hypothetical protein
MQVPPHPISPQGATPPPPRQLELEMSNKRIISFEYWVKGGKTLGRNFCGMRPGYMEEYSENKCPGVWTYRNFTASICLLSPPGERKFIECSAVNPPDSELLL